MIINTYFDIYTLLITGFSWALSFCVSKYLHTKSKITFFSLIFFLQKTKKCKKSHLAFFKLTEIDSTESPLPHLTFINILPPN